MRRSFWKPNKNMASILRVLLSLALVCTITAAPTELPADTTTVRNVPDEEVVEYVRVVDLIPVVEVTATQPADDVTETPATEDSHKLVKRSSLRGDNPSNDLLANLDGLNYENGLSSFAGRRIKFLPTFLG